MDQARRMRSVDNVGQQATAIFADAEIIARRIADDELIYVLSSDASLHTSVQQLIQQHRQETTSIDETQRTTRSGNEHEENTSEHEQTIPTVSRMRYPTPILQRLKPHQKVLEAFQFSAEEVSELNHINWHEEDFSGMLAVEKFGEEHSMNCPHCAATKTTERAKKTVMGYRMFWCGKCKRTFNERTGRPFNYLEYPTDIVLLVVLWRLRYKLSVRDLAEMFLERGFEFTHEAVREWEARFAPRLWDQLRAKRRGQAGTSCYVDETSVKVKGTWCYLYRAIDRDGNLVDWMGSPEARLTHARVGSVASASRFCRAFDEVRQFFRFRTTIKQPVSPSATT